MKTEVLYGIHPVNAAVKAERRVVLEIFLADTGSSHRLAGVVSRAEKRKIPIKRVSKEALARIAGSPSNQGVGARVGAYPTCRLSSVIESARETAKKPVFLLLDSILDPNNLGALVRTGLGFGVCAVVIPKDRAAQPTPTVSKVSAGALEHVQLVRTVNMVRAIRDLKEAGIWTFGMDRPEGRPIWSMDLTVPLAVVVGGEEKGIRPLVKKHCDDLLAVPQQGLLNSFNASVAGGIALFEIFRQRNSCVV